VNAADVVIMEGILVFHDPRLRAAMNMKIFVDTGLCTYYSLQFFGLVAGGIHMFMENIAIFMLSSLILQLLMQATVFMLLS
jgi:hypothetical protein